MPVGIETELKVAEYLLQIKAIKLQPKNPFSWASGWVSPIYCDNRISLSYPIIRTYIRQQLTQAIQEEFGTVNLIAGVATSGIPQGVLIAQELGLPFVYVRSTPKGHGMQNQIEGEIKQGQRTVIIEDLISTGKSSLEAIKALRKSDVEVIGLASVFTYGFKIAEQALADAKCRWFSLCGYETLLKKAIEDGFIGTDDLSLLRMWRENPAEWGKQD